MNGPAIGPPGRFPEQPGSRIPARGKQILVDPEARAASGVYEYGRYREPARFSSASERMFALGAEKLLDFHGLSADRSRVGDELAVDNDRQRYAVALYLNSSGRHHSLGVGGRTRIAKKAQFELSRKI